jgi:thioredoxin reductase (NADPH)
MQDRAAAEPKIEMAWNSVVEAVEGEPLVDRLQLRDVKTGNKTSLEVAGVFVSIGFIPNTAFLNNQLSLDKLGQIVTGSTMETSVPGVFAAGDVRAGSGRQAITAAGDGAAAAIYAERYLTV